MKGWYNRLRSPSAAFGHDLLMVPVAWLTAYWLRFNLDTIPPEYLQAAFLSLPLVMVVEGGYSGSLGCIVGSGVSHRYRISNAFSRPC